MFIELRSDTLTRPTEEMLTAVSSASYQDDTVERDYTVQLLESKAATLFGKEAALFTASGTMSNQLAIMVLTKRGDEIIVGEHSHIYNLEVGGLAALSQVQARPVQVRDRQVPVEEVERLLTRKGIQETRTSLLCLENSENLNEGNILAPSNIKLVSDIAHHYGAKVYTDGARILNVAVELGCDPAELVASSDAVMLTLTKGLCAPFGSVLMGTSDFIEQARSFKQRIGGGFRQAGFMAAPAIVALDTMIPRLKEDNQKAKLLAHAISGNTRLSVLNSVDTNIIRIKLADRVREEEFEELLRDRRINLKKIGRNEYRAVLSKDIDTVQLKQACEVLGNY